MTRRRSEPKITVSCWVFLLLHHTFKCEGWATGVSMLCLHKSGVIILSSVSSLKKEGMPYCESCKTHWSIFKPKLQHLQGRYCRLLFSYLSCLEDFGCFSVLGNFHFPLQLGQLTNRPQCLLMEQSLKTRARLEAQFNHTYCVNETQRTSLQINGICQRDCCSFGCSLLCFFGPLWTHKTLICKPSKP